MRVGGPAVWLIALCLGCHAMHPHTFEQATVVAEPSGETESEGPIVRVGPTESADCPQKPQITINIPKEIHVKESAEPKAAAPAAPTAEAQAVAALAQETILVPRMVYVPFQAQTPVAPVRMVQVQGAPVGTAVGPLAGSGAVGTADAATAEQLLRLTRIVEELAGRVERLQQSAGPAGARPAESGPSCPPPTTPRWPNR